MVPCPRCRLLSFVCFCDEIEPIPTRTRIVVIRHALEARRGSNTGRLANLALANAELLEFGGPGAPLEEPAFDRRDTVVLFPDGPVSQMPALRPRTVVVLDGSWTQARHMRQRIAGVRGLPAWGLPAPPAVDRVRLRRPRREGQVSTIEAIAQALRLLEGEAPAAALEALFDRFVDASARTGRVLDRRGETSA